MDSDVNTTVQISKIVAPNSGEPFVVETKTTTTTTTTTTTKRICVGKDANVDMTEIQALLDNDDGTDTQLTTHQHADAAAAILDTVPPKVNVNTTTTTKKSNKSKQQPHEPTVDKSKGNKSKSSSQRNTTVKRLSDVNRSPLLSSTKIENSGKSSSPNKSHHSFKEPQQQKSATEIVCSPNLSKISGSSKSKSNGKTKKIIKNNSKTKSTNDIKKSAKPATKQDKKTRKKSTATAAARKSVKCEQMDPPQSTRSLRSKVESQDPNYIDDLISKYIALDKKPSTRRKKPRAAAPKVEKPTPATATAPAPVVPAPAMPQPPPIDLPDLSAIFESSTEGETVATAAPATVNTTDDAGSLSFDAPGNDFIDDDWRSFDDEQEPALSSTANEQLPELSTVGDADNVDVDDIAMLLKEHTKSNRTKRKLPLSDTSDQNAAKQTNDNAAKRSKKMVRKEPSTTKKTASATTKATSKKPAQSVECDSTTKTAADVSVPSAINESVRSVINYQPIKLYSPSHRGRLRTVANNKLILSKRSITKKLQNFSTPSKNSLLERFSGSHPMTIDADSRLIWLHPNANGGTDSDGNGHEPNGGSGKDKSNAGNGIDDSIATNKSTGMDMLKRLQQTKRPLLVKEICTTEL